MTTISSAQRKRLRGLAHSIQPTVMIGQGGLTENVVKAVDQELAAHELIKVRFQAFKEDRRALAEDLAGRTGAAVAGVVGHVAVLYRPADEPARRQVNPGPA